MSPGDQSDNGQRSQAISRVLAKELPHSVSDGRGSDNNGETIEPRKAQPKRPRSSLSVKTPKKNRRVLREKAEDMEVDLPTCQSGGLPSYSSLRKKSKEKAGVLADKSVPLLPATASTSDGLQNKK